ncbi:MAG: DUF5676 family membrane protein [Methylophilaceae bacterium]|jgi:hypothetical protein|nr:DUF5676 family membrane protein [Methylophilaceae bacterium]
MDRLNPWRTGGATALTVAIVSVVCAVAVYLFPQGTVGFVNSWTHGLDLTVLRSDRPWTLDWLALGLFNVTLTGFLIGVLFAWCYNLAGKCCR